MKGKAKALGVALAAVWALGALGAAGAQGATDSFHLHSDQARNVITAHAEEGEAGTQTFTFRNAGGEPVATIACEDLTLQGDTTGVKHESEGVTTYTSEGLTVGFEYSGCEASVGGGMTIDSAGCHYLLSSETASGHGQLHTSCDGEPIRITTEAGCTITIAGEQTPDGGVKYDEPSATEDTTITAEITLSGIEYSANFICQLGGIPASGSNAEQAGNITMEAFEYIEGSTGSYVHNEVPLPFWHGPTK